MNHVLGSVFYQRISIWGWLYMYDPPEVAVEYVFPKTVSF